MDKARERVGAYAADQGWQYVDDRSTAESMVFRNGMTAATWGQWVTVSLTAVAEDRTHVLVETKAAGMQLYDWGQGKRIAKQLLAALQPAGGAPTTAS
jgi:hypothetical protein